MKKLFFLIALALSPVMTFAQTPTGCVLFYGSGLQDSSGNLESAGTITLAPVNATGQPISYRSACKVAGQASARPVTANVVHGAYALYLPDTTLTSPANICFSGTAIDTATGYSLLGPGYTCIQPHGTATGSGDWCQASACDFDLYSPSLSTLAIIQTGPTGPQGATGPTGATGATGTAATIAVGATTTGAAGSNATVTNTGTSSAAVLAFTVPQGAMGATGATGATGTAATVTVGTTTTGAAGSSATVTNTGTSSAAVLAFTVPQGATGATGAAGTIAVGTVSSGTAAVTNVGTPSAAILNFTFPAGGSGTLTNLSAGTWPSWLTPTITNPTTTPSVAVAASAIPNSALANTATTVNGQTCTLGSTCTAAAAAGTLTGATLASGVTGSSLVSAAGGTFGTAAFTATSAYDASGAAATALSSAEAYSANASNLASGTVAAARLPNPTASTLGGVESLASTSHKYLTSISTSGVPAVAQPLSADLSDLGSASGAAQLNASGYLPTAQGGTGEASLTGPRYANGASADTVATSAQLRAAIGAGIYDASGAATTALGNAVALSQAANTIIGNPTAATASLMAMAMPSCSTSGVSALTWITNTGFGCNSISASLSFPQTAGGTINSGGVLFANSGTQLSVSAAGAAGAIMKWGGAATAPGSSGLSESGSVLTNTDTETISSVGGASLPSLLFSGAPYTSGTSTTNFPKLFFQSGSPMAVSTFSTGGTYAGINSPYGFTGDYLAFFQNGYPMIRMNSGGGGYGYISLYGNNGAQNVTISIAANNTLELNNGGPGFFLLSSIGNANGTTLTAGTAAGSSPTIACVTSHGGCSSLSGTVSLTTGTSPTTGVLMTITASTHQVLPDCTANIVLSSSPYTAATNFLWSYTTSLWTLNIGSALSASTAYTISYTCLGF